MSRIVVADGKRSWIQEVPPGTERISVGRALTNTVIIDDSAASREHCVLEPGDDGAYWLRDLNSRNGTRLNGRYVDKALLREGDRIEIGATSIALVAEGEGGDTAEQLEARLKEQLAQGAAELTVDYLTGLSSYPAFLQRLHEALETSPQLALVKVDIDYLGLLNDMFGMRAGDSVIRAIGRGIGQVLSDARWGRACAAREAGGKYLLFVPEADAQAGRELAQALREAAGKRTFEGALSEATVTLSAGVAQAPDDAKEALDLLLRAEAALAAAKRRGRDRIVLAATSAKAVVDGVKSIAIHDTRASGLWAASGIWDPKIARAEPAIEGAQPAEVVASLTLTHAGQSLLSLITQALGSDLELDSLLELSLGILVETAQARRGFCLLRDSSGSMRLRRAVHRGVPGVESQESAISQRIVKEVVDTRAAVLVIDAQTDGRFKDSESIVAKGLRSVVAAPVLWGQDVVGVIYLDNKTVADRFGKEQRDLVLAFGRLMAGPIRRQLLHEARGEELERARAALARTAETETRRRHRYANIIGEAASMKAMFRLLDRLAETHHPVLIHGESGTGKELVATAIHYNGPRRDEPFIAENCAAFSDSLLESELFGHVKGAFTGANTDRIGLVEAASGGTLFLDEIGEMTPGMQAKLLRVLQEGELRPVGGREVRKVDVRLIAASNRNLLEMSRAGTFREDLYYRIAVMTIDVPPLRERREDIPLLIEHFLSSGARDAGRDLPDLTRDALQLLVHHEWPGNVRELENEVKKLLTLADDTIDTRHLSPRFLAGAAPDRAQSAIRRVAVADGTDALMLMIERGKPLAGVIEEFEMEAIRRILDTTGGNRSETARRLGLSRPGLLKKMKRYGIS